jgi:hypothetical protein
MTRTERLRTLVQQRLWKGRCAVFETRLESGKFANVREQIGCTR